MLQTFPACLCRHSMRHICTGSELFFASDACFLCEHASVFLISSAFFSLQISLDTLPVHQPSHGIQWFCQLLQGLLNTPVNACFLLVIGLALFVLFP